MNLLQRAGFRAIRQWRPPGAPIARGSGRTWYRVLPLLVVASCGWASGGADRVCDCGNGSPQQVEAMRLGEQVMAAAEAISSADSPDAIAAITRLGHDSRYYTMTRGWLLQVLQGNQSILDASAPGSRPELEARQEVLRRALRAIDLE
jgi:thiazole synthase ThiGH ThiG subunit